ncbi:MAG: hypothetical protein HQK51_07920 [Oligoflexia bacterium]|nr:hypothetical protein [Oligoflexia bacterium]
MKMKRYKMTFYILNFCLFLLYAPNSFADLKTAAELEAKRVELNLLEVHLKAISATVGKYKTIRDNFFYGDNGLKTRSETYFDKCNDFIAAWKGIVELAKSPTVFNDPRTREELKIEIQKRMSEYQSILADVDFLENRSKDALSELTKMQEFPANYVDSRFKAHLEALNKNIKQLVDSINLITSNINRQAARLLDKINSASGQAILLKLANASLQFPELRRVLAEIDAMFKAEQVIYPPYNELTVMKSQLTTTLAGEIRVFAAEKILKKMHDFAQKSTQTIDSSSIPAERKTYGINQIKKVMLAAEELFNNTLKSGGKPTFVYQYYKNSLEMVPFACRDEEMRFQYNCQLMRQLLGFNYSAFEKMNEDTLRYFEESLDRVYAGPLTVGEKNDK